MAEYIKKIRTPDGDLPIDYNALANLPELGTLASKDVEYVDQKIAAIVDSSPETLNTLNELAAALGDDPNFATTVVEEIGKKVDKVEGKGLSTNDYTTAEKQKLASISEVAISGSYSDLTDTPIITSEIDNDGVVFISSTNNGTGGGGGGISSAIMDVTELPTENINENALYRLEKINAYVVTTVPGGYLAMISAEDAAVLKQLHLTINIRAVDALPDNMPVIDPFNNLDVFVLNNTGIGYVNVGTQIVPVGTLFEMSDGGWCDTASSVLKEENEMTLFYKKSHALYAYYDNTWHNLSDKEQIIELGTIDGSLLQAIYFTDQVDKFIQNPYNVKFSLIYDGVEIVLPFRMTKKPSGDIGYCYEAVCSFYTETGLQPRLISIVALGGFCVPLAVSLNAG